jgi:hypothetical protein
MYYRIDNDLNITLPKDLSWLKNSNNNYEKTFPHYHNEPDYENTDEFMELYRTRGEYTIKQIVENVRGNEQHENSDDK